MKDLIILVADKNAQFCLRGGLARHQSIGIRPIEIEFRVHPERDGGARKNGVSLLAIERGRFANAVLMFDFEGSGASHADALSLEEDLDRELVKTWGATAKAIVLDPEVDSWVWGSDNSLAQSLNWAEPLPIRRWIEDQGFKLDANGKPVRPKEAIESVLRKQRMPRSSAIYEKITSNVSISRCVDPAALRLRNWLVSRFPKDEQQRS
jgi:hypothetical protein